MSEKEGKITIATAFFPLKRDIWAGFERSNQKYYDYFDFWARIQNDLIVYTDKESKEKIEKIRIEKYGRENTTIIVIDDYTKIDEELYNSVKRATENEHNIKFHLHEKNPESWNADYNYIMILKPWFVNDAMKNHGANGMIAWIDLGYNHGGKYYTNPQEFDFEWKYPFTNKMHFFSIKGVTVKDVTDFPVFESIKLMSSYIQGGLIVGPDFIWEELWNSVRTNTLFLNKIGLMDDDQIFYVLFYKEKPELCELHESDWFWPFKQFSDQTFTTIENRKKKSKFKLFKAKLRWRSTIRKYTKRWYKIMIEEETRG